MVIRNNVPGYEKEILERFDEPTWNNPVMRFVDGKGADVIPRKDRVWTTAGVLERMQESLVAARRDVPVWLRTTAHETASGDVETALFAMF